jgi:anti-sigma B factor antagonist
VRIAVRFQDDVAIMVLNGKFLAAGDGPALRQKVKELIDGGARKLVINFADVPYIDSTGLGFLAGSRITAQNSGVDLVLSNVGPHVKKILDSVRLSDFFTIASDEGTALRQAKESGESSGLGNSSGAKAAKAKRPPSPSTEPR